MTKSFNDLSFGARFQTMGDTAEAIFLDRTPLGRSITYGWSRPPLTMRLMEEFVRHTPDFYTETGWLVEAMGVGSDGLIKLKESKYRSLLEWNKKQKTALFVWNSHRSEWAICDMDAVKKLVGAARKEGRVDTFHDGPTFFGLPWDLFVEAAKLTGT